MPLANEALSAELIVGIRKRSTVGQQAVHVRLEQVIPRRIISFLVRERIKGMLNPMLIFIHAS